MFKEQRLMRNKTLPLVAFLLWCIWVIWWAVFGFSKPLVVAILLSLATFFIISTVYREHRSMKEYVKRIRLNLESTGKKQGSF